MKKEWHEQTKLAWVKVYRQLYDCPEHRNLKPATMGILVGMMILANQYGRQPDGNAVILSVKKSALSPREIGAFCHCGEKTARRAIGELMEVGTVFQREDGAYYFENFRRFQESPSAARMRRLRKLKLIPGGGEGASL